MGDFIFYSVHLLQPPSIFGESNMCVRCSTGNLHALVLVKTILHVFDYITLDFFLFQPIRND